MVQADIKTPFGNSSRFVTLLAESRKFKRAGKNPVDSIYFSKGNGSGNWCLAVRTRVLYIVAIYIASIREEILFVSDNGRNRIDNLQCN